jgi:hypothetical protein
MARETQRNMNWQERAINTLLSPDTSQERKNLLTVEYEAIDPVNLLVKLKSLQDALWEFSWHKEGRSEPELLVVPEDVANDAATNLKR